MRITFIISLLMISLALMGTTYIVDQDGIGDFTTIQSSSNSTSVVDRTRQDIGYLPVDQDSITNTRTLKTGWNWLCFPRLKRVDYVNNSINQPTFGTGKFLGSLWDDTVTGADPFQINGNNGINTFSYPSWNYQNFIIESIDGFKLSMSGNATESQIGTLNSPDTKIELTNLNSRYWQIGYILADPGLITEVVPTGMLQYEFQIQAQNWCATYKPNQLGNTGWKYDTSSEPTIKSGQMIVIKIVGISSFDFQ